MTRRDETGRRARAATAALAGVALLGGVFSAGLAFAQAAAAGGVYRIPDPIAHAKSRIEETCLNVRYDDGFVQRMDLNADGLEDVVITDIVVCDGYHSVFCGLGGCTGGVYLALPGGGFTLTDLPPDVTVTVARGRPAVRARGGGETGIYVWLGDRFVRQERMARVDQTATSAYGAAAAEAAANALALGDPIDAAPVFYDVENADIDLWRLASTTTGAARAYTRGADGASILSLGCVAGQPAFTLSIRPTDSAADTLPYQLDARIAVNALIRGRVAERLSLAYSETDDLWHVAIPSRGGVVEALMRADTVTFRQDGALDYIGRFSLRGSAAAIRSLRERCQI